MTNPFATVVGIITAVAGLGIISYGLKASSTYQNALDQADSAYGKLRRHSQAALYPTLENAEAKKEAVKLYSRDAEEVEGIFKRYTVDQEPLQDIDAGAFSARVRQAADALKLMAAESQLELPENFAVGFESELRSPPRPESTGELSYELKALSWLTTELANAGVTKLVNINRMKTEFEGADVEKVAGASRMPIELVFSGSELAFRKFTAALASSEEYFFITRALRLKSSVTTAPERSEAQFGGATAVEEENGSDTFDFGEVTTDDITTSDEREVNNELKVQQIVGAEKLYVGLVIELLLYQ